MHTTPSGLILPGAAPVRKAHVAKMHGLHIFARNGRVQLERVNRKNDGLDSRSCTTKEAHARIDAMAAQLKHMRQLPNYDRNSAKLLESFLTEFQEVTKQAEEQGPFEYEDMRRARLRSAPKTISFT